MVLLARDVCGRGDSVTSECGDRRYGQNPDDGKDADEKKGSPVHVILIGGEYHKFIDLNPAECVIFLA
jgi:hypothetical protein